MRCVLKKEISASWSFDGSACGYGGFLLFPVKRKPSLWYPQNQVSYNQEHSDEQQRENARVVSRKNKGIRRDNTIRHAATNCAGFSTCDIPRPSMSSPRHSDSYGLTETS